MSTDFENELRDLFREKAAEAPLATPAMPASAPPQVLRRGRLHQVGTVLGSAVVALVLIVGSVAGLTRILGEGPDRIETANYDVFHRTATVEAFTVGSPSDWFLVNQWPLSMLIAVEGTSSSSKFECVGSVPGGDVQECEETPTTPVSSPLPLPQGLPMIQLSNVDLGLSTNACADGLPGGAAVLYVALDYDAAIGGIADPSIQEFPPGAGLPPEGDGPCGPGRYAHFTVNGERFFSWIGVGSAVSDEDRETVETSYEMMSAIPDWTPSPPDQVTPGYVVAGGPSESGEGWRLELRSGGPRPNLTLDRSDGDPVGSPIEEVLSGSSYEPELTDPIFGTIAMGATGVEFRPGTENAILDLGQSPVAGTIVPIPPTMGEFDFDLFFIDPPADYAALGGHVIALGVPVSSISPSPAAEADVVELSGSYGQHTWIVGFTGPLDETPCIRVNVDRADLAPHCSERLADADVSNQPLLHIWLTDAFYLRAGAVSENVDDIRFRSDDGTEPHMEFQCAVAPAGWSDPARRICVVVLPPEGVGTFEYLDADGAILFEEETLWGLAEPEVPTPVDPVHGGTYWAVYPWVGAPGSREADDVSASLLQEFGIEAFPGDLSCDDGAAEALGTDAPQGIGVYFETQEEANDFAMQAGLLGHEADPVIARVTTYCLD